MSSRGFSRDAAIVGIGATEFSKNSGRPELQLACEAIIAALADAGIDPSEVDGLSTYTAETNGEVLVARNCGLGELKFFSRIGYGGGAACGVDDLPCGRRQAGLGELPGGLSRVLRQPDEGRGSFPPDLPAQSDRHAFRLLPAAPGSVPGLGERCGK